MLRDKRVKSGIIIGAGIGGLTTAIALAKKGIDATVYERADEIREIGAGIWVAPNGLKVFEKLGIAGDIIEAGSELEKISIVDVGGKTISEIDNRKVKAKHGFATIALHRARLQKTLAAHLPKDKIIPGKRFVSYKQTGENITAFFADGTSCEADFLICADGVNSNGRKQIYPSVEMRYSGQTCWRFVTAHEMPAGEENKMREIWGAGKGLRAAYSRVDDRSIYCYITVCAAADGADDLQTLKNDLLDLCREFPDFVKSLIESADAKDFIRTDLYDFKPIKKWTDERAVLIGDAAHATTPNLGQGACQAIEDALVVAEELARTNDIAGAFLNFQKRRIEKATYITNASWQFGQMTNTGGFVKTIVKTLMRMMPERLSERQLDRIYTTDG